MEIYFLQVGPVPSPADHSALFANSSSGYKVSGALPDFGKNYLHGKMKSSK